MYKPPLTTADCTEVDAKPVETPKKKSSTGAKSTAKKHEVKKAAPVAPVEMDASDDEEPTPTKSPESKAPEPKAPAKKRGPSAEKNSEKATKKRTTKPKTTKETQERRSKSVESEEGASRKARTKPPTCVAEFSDMDRLIVERRRQNVTYPAIMEELGDSSPPFNTLKNRGNRLLAIAQSWTEDDLKILVASRHHVQLDIEEKIKALNSSCWSAVSANMSENGSSQKYMAQAVEIKYNHLLKNGLIVNGTYVGTVEDPVAESSESKLNPNEKAESVKQEDEEMGNDSDA